MNFIRPLIMTGILLCSVPVLAQDAGTSMASRPSARVSIDPKLRITDEQRTKLGALRDQYILDTATQKAQLKVAKHQLRQVLSQATIDKSAAMNLQSKINGLKGDLSNARLSMRLTASDVFTPEQRAQFKSMRGKWKHHHKGGFQRGFSGKRHCSAMKVS